MKVVGKKRVKSFSRQHTDASSQITAWLAEAEEAEWHTPNDIKMRYPQASFLENNRVMFNIKGNKYRLDTKVNYKSQVVLIMRIGTHAEYDKRKF